MKREYVIVHAMISKQPYRFCHRRNESLQILHLEHGSRHKFCPIPEEIYRKIFGRRLSKLVHSQRIFPEGLLQMLLEGRVSVCRGE
jgi:hypothetical protein